MSVDAASLMIVHYPAAILRRKAVPVPQVTAEVRAVAGRMIELMFEADGIGLAAPQVGLPWRLFVVHVPEEQAEGRLASTDPAGATAAPTVYVNPVLSAFDGVPEPMSEGCLSLPDIRGDVLRPPGVTIRATDLEGKPFEQRGSGLLARCWQHEMDHLDGVLIIDKMLQRDRLKNRTAIRDLERGS
ncbi:MAG: peptide deformylase [Phycisphaerales bacterium]